MDLRRLERRVREVEQMRINAAECAERDWTMRFLRASMGDKELDALTRPLAELQARHGPDSPEAQAELERIRADYDRIIETRYASFLDEPPPEDASLR